mmetsp:Transcript_22847/g.49599  ORF Transcript_22847/g.49599 Transcript_22847/m.49599 type:complete len:118 (-) Transcript_22847:37-390(-)
MTLLRSGRAAIAAKVAAQQKYFGTLVTSSYARIPPTSIFYISTEAIKLFHPKEGQTVVDAIKNRMDLCFGVANNTVPLEAVLEMHDVDETMTDRRGPATLVEKARTSTRGAGMESGR